MRSGSVGPCDHCGTYETPCWRKGPPEKPVLCNACGARYLVKRDLAGYFPGTRKGGALPLEVPQPAHENVKHKAPRAKPQAPRAAVGSKRPRTTKALDDDSFQAQARRMYEEYRVLQELSVAALFYQQQPGTSGFDASHSGPSDSTSAASHEEESFGKESHYLDASSEDYQEHHQDVQHASSGRQACAVQFSRRPRKQSRPMAAVC